MLGVHVWEVLDELADLANEAAALLGGDSKSSASEQLELAVIERAEDFVEKFGLIPPKTAKEERKAYAQKIADFTIQQLRKSTRKSH